MTCFIVNLVAGKRDIEVSSDSHLLCSKVLHHTNHSIGARILNEGLFLIRVQEEKVLILYSDDTAYMLNAATALKVFYSNLIHFACLAHGLQGVAKEVRAKFSQVNRLILMLKCF
jgi:hypothetical protein